MTIINHLIKAIKEQGSQFTIKTLQDAFRKSGQTTRVQSIQRELFRLKNLGFVAPDKMVKFQEGSGGYVRAWKVLDTNFVMPQIQRPMNNGKRKAVVEAAKYLGNFTAYMLWLTLRAAGHEFERYEVSRYIYRLRQMGLVMHESNSWGDGRQKIWRIIDQNFTTVGKSVGVTAAVRRAVAASNPQFFLRGMEKTKQRFTREDIAKVLCNLKKHGKIAAQKSLAKNINIYTK